MQSWLDNFKALNGLTNNPEAARVTSHRPSKTAQRRLGKALALKHSDLKIANRRARLGQPVTQIGHLDRFSEVSRRNPRKA